MTLIGYCDRLSALPRQTIRFMVSSSSPFRASLERLHGVDTSHGGAGTVERERLTAAFEGEYEGNVKHLRTGSYAVSEPRWPTNQRDHSFVFDIWIQPTRADGHQIIADARDANGEPLWQLALARSQLTLRIGQRNVMTLLHSAARTSWTRLLLRYDDSRAVASLLADVVDPWPALAGRQCAESAVERINMSELRVLTLAANVRGEHCFDGRLDSPRLVAGAVTAAQLRSVELGEQAPLHGTTPIAAWDFSLEQCSARAVDTSGNDFHARLVNRPTRSVIGRGWDGSTMRVHDHPEQWSAIHFHSDDLDDAGWAPDFEFELPSDLASGIYTARLSNDQGDYDVPFYVLPHSSQRAKVAFLAPTNTYLAYGNEHLGVGERADAHEKMMTSPIVLNDTDRALASNPNLGLSIYDSHRDGSGVTYGSRLRPIVNWQPDYVTWLNAGRRQFAADFYIVGWLETVGVHFDVLTDEALHLGGIDLLAGYDVVITGSHPEYVTRVEWDALAQYTREGGKLMYLGGNGFFWVTSYSEPSTNVIEVRRGYAAQRNWTSHPAELHHSTTGELGGAWMHQGRPPHALVGVGLAAVGWDTGSGFTRTAASYGKEHDNLFRGIDTNVVGDFGLVLGGAAGDELDSADLRRGTPANAVVLMSSQHGDKYLPTLDARMGIEPGMEGSANTEVRADVVLVDVGGGGEIFSVGSISWAGSLAYNGYDNNVATLTTNVLHRFLGVG